MTFPITPPLNASSLTQNDAQIGLTWGSVAQRPRVAVSSSPRLLLPKPFENNRINQMQALGEVGAVLGVPLSQL